MIYSREHKILFVKLVYIGNTMLSMKENRKRPKPRRALPLSAILPLFSFLVSCAMSGAALLKDDVEDEGIPPDRESGIEQTELPVLPELPEQIEPPQPSFELLETEDEGLPPLHLTFLGDIMAHDANQATPDLSWIYSDTASFLLSDDLTFANFETPLSASLPMSTYPRFNAHPPYLEAAIAGGCDVFSLANNHINDQGGDAIVETLDEFSKLLSNGEIAGFSGIRRVGADSMQPSIIEKKGWKILYLAATEILNDYSKALGLIYYTPASKSGRETFKKELARMRDENPCDLFILSLHTDEPEYVIEASAAKRAYFRELATECGVDIIWSHHPHVNQPWELIPRGEGERPAFAIYSSGNFISAQRTSHNTQNPSSSLEYTGDAFIFRVVVTENLLTPIPVLVTSYRDTSAPKDSRNRYFTVRHFNSRFIEGLEGEEKAYFQARFELMRQFMQE